MAASIPGKVSILILTLSFISQIFSDDLLHKEADHDDQNVEGAFVREDSKIISSLVDLPPASAEAFLPSIDEPVVDGDKTAPDSAGIDMSILDEKATDAGDQVDDPEQLESNRAETPSITLAPYEDLSVASNNDDSPDLANFAIPLSKSESILPVESEVLEPTIADEGTVEKPDLGASKENLYSNESKESSNSFSEEANKESQQDKGDHTNPNNFEEADAKQNSDDANGYAKGSVCGYCKYCKLCHLCDAECPCEVSEEKPFCENCKYCKYCYLCDSVCDTVCQPGGLLDVFTSAIYGALPSLSEKTQADIDKDIERAKDFIKEYL